MTKSSARREMAEQFEERYIYRSRSRTLYPKVNIGGIEGGAPYRPNYFPGVARFTSTCASAAASAAGHDQHEIETALNSLGSNTISSLQSLLVTKAGTWSPREVRGGSSPVSFWREDQAGDPERASIWTDTNIYNEMASRRSRSARRPAHRSTNEEIDIDVMVKRHRSTR